MGAGKRDNRVFSLQGAEHAYRMLIECMNEGALTLTSDAVILYANQCFAQMVRRPLGQVIGSSFLHFISPEERVRLRPLLRRATRAGAKFAVHLNARDGTHLTVQLSLRPLARTLQEGTVLGLVVTDMTEARRNEKLMRALAHRIVVVQEAERTRVALELHNNITQLLIAVQFSSQALADKLTVRDGPAKREADTLRSLLSQTAAEVERISRNLRPSLLDQLGLFAVLRPTCTEFAARTGVAVQLAGTPLAERLPADTELALYRIVQESLKNVEKHARARHVSVSLRQTSAFVRLVITDDGIGFDSRHHAARRKDQAVLGLAGMRERAACVGGTLTIKSGLRAGTSVTVVIPQPTGTTAAAAGKAA